MSTLTSQELLELFREGKSDAATAIFNRYVTRLIALARSRIGTKLKPRIDPEDVVQSAYRSFFLHAKNDEYRCPESGDLWRLLASIALNKLYGQIEKSSAAKRAVNREAPVDDWTVDIQAPDPRPEEVVAAAEELQLVMDGLTPEEREVLVACMQEPSLDELGKLLGKSQRTIRRRIAEVRRKLEQRLLGTEACDSTAERFDPGLMAPLLYSEYKLEKLLGSGGMGKVYRARVKSTGDKVAIKALHKSRQSDQRAVAQLLQEAQILARLQHPNIVKVRGLGRFPSGSYFIVMDFVDGTDLQSRVHQGPLPLRSVLRVAKLVADAIQYAHDQGVVHCDIKPGNVLVTNDEQVVVTDFGFAFLVANAASARRGTIGGTAEYIAPEILLGDKPTPAADVYSLGTLIWTLATGKTPSSDGDVAAGELSLLQSICRLCRAFEPADRYPSVNEVILALERLADSGPDPT